VSLLFRRYESFYSGLFPGRTVQFYGATAFLSADTDFPSAPTKIEIGATDIKAGQFFKLTNTAAFGSDYGYLRALEDSSSSDSPCYLKAEPLFSDEDSEEPFSLAGTSFEGGALKSILSGGTTSSSSVSNEIVSLKLDLSDAPKGSYEYLLFCVAEFTHNDTVAREISVKVQEVEPGESISTDATGTFGDAKVTLQNQNGADSEVYNFGSVSVHSVKGGEVKKFSLQASIEPNASGKMVTCSNARMWALRIDNKTHVKVGTGLLGETTTNAPTSTPVDHLSIGTLDSEEYLVFAGWATGHDTNGASEQAGSQFVDDAANIRAESYSFGQVPTSTKWQAAHVSLFTGAGAGNCKIQALNLSGTGNSKAYDGAIVAIKASDITAVSDLYQASSTTTNNQATWASLVDLGEDSSATDGDFVDIASFTVLKSANTDGTTWNIRPNFQGRTDLGLAGFNESWKTAPISFFRTKTRGGTNADNILEVQYPDSSGPTIGAEEISFIHYQHPPAQVLLDNESVNYLVDTEAAAILRFGWVTSGGSVYTYDLSGEDFDDLSEVYLNRSKMTRLETWSAGTDNTWHFDPAVGTLTIQIDSADTPEDDDVWISYVGVYRYASKPVDITTKGGVIPYRDRMIQIPSVTSSLSVDSGVPQVSSSTGELALANADGAFDDLFSQKTISGHETTIRRGFPRLSANIDDFSLVSRNLQGIPSVSLDMLGISLFDRSRLLSVDIDAGEITVYKGQNGNVTQVDNFKLPIVYGYVKKAPAYRVTNNFGTSNSDLNTFVFAQRICSNLSSNVYANTDDGIKVTATTAAISGSYGAVIVSNDAWDHDGSFALVPDVVFADVYGFVEPGGAETDSPINTPGAIIYDFLTQYGGLSPEDIDLESLNFLDHPRNGTPPARHQWLSGLPDWRPSEIGLLIDGGFPVADAMDSICQQIFSFWRTTSQGRVSVSVPDMNGNRIANLIDNGNFELRSHDSEFGSYPWQTSGGATISVASGGYRGNWAGEVSNNGNAFTHAFQQVQISSPGTYASSCLAKLTSGESSKALLSLQTEDDTQYFSETRTLSTDAWTRLFISVELKQGNVGQALLRLMPAYDSTTATVVKFDEVEVYKVFAVLDKNNCDILGIELSEEDHFAAQVPFLGDLDGSGVKPTVTVTNTEAEGVSTTFPEGKAAVLDSSVLVLTEGSHATAPSATGIAAAAASYYGRQRIEASVVVFGISTAPEVGDWVAVAPDYLGIAHPRFPTLNDSRVMWRIIETEFNPATPQSVNLRISTHLNPIGDTLSK